MTPHFWRNINVVAVLTGRHVHICDCARRLHTRQLHVQHTGRHSMTALSKSPWSGHSVGQWRPGSEEWHTKLHVFLAEANLVRGERPKGATPAVRGGTLRSLPSDAGASGAGLWLAFTPLNRILAISCRHKHRIGICASGYLGIQNFLNQ